ncbi:ABC transporter substrate-binding protein [Paenibacillus polymyxa]|uniref:ABC transporter substrate-binding protein n=1 Tax=Paenibacillus polymyxa TaxID=1406 RepID=UPI00058A52A4|nr:ABC transporter substrate-binding protein [Paenibacillus polymyxa]AJE51961.1 spermidine/putrescine ABC transporter substrate-binding protein [Paenibacillus polymyxa]QOH64224.1 spermidine/putrescine ABC transporter substrate-binding protein [Paenibacillus polymyxa]
MKKWFKGFMAVTLASVVLAGCGSNATSGQTDGKDGSADGKKKLVISTWGFSEDFFNKEVYEPFEKEHNVDIVVEIGNNAERLNKISQGSTDVDLIYLSDYYAQQGIQQGLFEKLDRSKVPNLNQIYDIAKAPLGEEYGPAYTVGRLGIAYNPELVKKDVTSWADLWGTEFKGNVTLPNITATAGPMMVDVASKVAGSKEFNEDQAFGKLKELSPNIVKFYSKTSEFVNMFSQQEIAGGPIMEMYFKDLQAAVPGAKFVAPSEGAYAVMNTINVVKGSDQKELAEEFINWQLSKEVQEKSAKAKVDSPVNTQVVLSGADTQGITYGADVVNKLTKLDMKFVNDHIKAWTDRWNREVTQ